jgi:hypothetical protein
VTGPGGAALARPPGEPPLYRRFALLSLASALLVGIPLGLWMLIWLYWSGPAVSTPWRVLHAHAQIIGFFGVLIPGMAQHVLARFAGRAVAPHAALRWTLALLATGLGLRVVDVAAGFAAASLAGAGLQAASFGIFAGWVWRMLSAPPLAALRRHLVTSTAALALALALEAWLRSRALAAGLAVPDVQGMRAVHAIALHAGVLGWVLGVLLRAGPMFVAAWRPPAAAARTAIWFLAVGAVVAAMGEALSLAVLSRLGECAALGTVLGVLLLGGAFRRAHGALPMLARGPAEARIFRLALASAVGATAGLATASLLAATGRPDHLVTDAARHLLTVGFLTSVVVAMAFRLVPVIERWPLPWPGLRAVAFWALVTAVALRTAETLVGAGWVAIAMLVPLAGVAAWAAVACVAVTLVRVIRDSR